MDEQKILAEQRLLKNWEIIAALTILALVIAGGLIYAVANFLLLFITLGLSKRH